PIGKSLLAEVAVRRHGAGSLGCTTCKGHTEDPTPVERRRPATVARGVAEARSHRRRAGSPPGQVVGEIGAGPGYFTLRLARAVGPSGRVDAVDPEPRVLEALRWRLAQAR